MVRKIAIASAFAGSALCASLAFAAGPPKLPNFGHYVGYGTITVATDCPASLTVGQSFQNQLELNTPAERLVVLIRQVVPGSSPDYVPAIVKTRLEKTGGTHLSPSGTAVISDEVGGSEVDGTYLASYTPLDPNSFLANITVQYPYTPPGGTAGTCSLTTETAYIRSSAD